MVERDNQSRRRSKAFNGARQMSVMSLRRKIGCCSLPICALACIAWLCCYAKGYEFELCIYDRVPDLARLSTFDLGFNFFRGDNYPLGKACRICDNTGMFLRATKRTKDGKTHLYWSLVEDVRVGRHVFQRRGCALAVERWLHL